MITLENEVWRAVVSVPNNDYLVSNLGRVFSIKARIFLTPSLHKSRCKYYLRHNLNGDKFMTHILVAKHFPEIVVRNCLEDTQLDHLDGNTLNPAAYNLAWKTQGLNLRAWHAGRKIEFNGQQYQVKKKTKGKKK